MFFRRATILTKKIVIESASSKNLSVARSRQGKRMPLINVYIVYLHHIRGRYCGLFFVIVMVTSPIVVEALAHETRLTVSDIVIVAVVIRIFSRILTPVLKTTLKNNANIGPSLKAICSLGMLKFEGYVY